MNDGEIYESFAVPLWSDISHSEQFPAHRLLTVEGPDSKTRRTRHVPLNDEATRVLESWREQSGDGPRVFEISTGLKTAWGHIRKRANIVGFRGHDLRHHFASRLVQHGVPLNTVRDLPGHSSIAMSLRYAHLAPDQRREAVAMLNQKPNRFLRLRCAYHRMPRSRVRVPLSPPMKSKCYQRALHLGIRL